MWEGTRNQGGTVRRRRRSGWAAVLAVIGVVFAGAGAGPAGADPSGVGVDTVLDLQDDGSLAVTTVITAPPGRAIAQRLPLSVPVEGNRTQHFTVTGTRAENGSVSVSDGALQVSAPGGTTKVTYTVRGTVADGPELQQFTWPIAAGYTVDLDTVTMRFASPTAVPDSPLCGIGQVGERRMCTLTQTDASGVVTAQQNGLPQGRVAVFTTLLPAGTVAADARFTATAAPAPERDTGGLIALSLAAVLAVALAGYGYVRRRSDAAAAHSAGATADLLVPGANGEIAFASPDGVLPGQIGTLLDGRLRPTDVGATVLDLAVRGYLWLAALPDGDFQISRRAPLDGAVTPAERVVVDALLPHGAETTTVSELTGGARPLDPAPIVAAVPAATAERGWLRAAPRSALLVPAIAVAAGGAIATLVCGFLGAGVLWAAAALVLGLGLVAAALLWPRRTASGSRLAAGLGGMRQYLIATNVGSLPDGQRDVLFERAIPYTHAFGDLRGWLATWGGVPSAPLDWYRAPQGPVAGLATLAAVLDGAVAQALAAQRD
ncbi:DUF2207 family protein [Tsukamurella pulmonis]|uniref:DUF2207 family protein n=1 Tax=Tsukamurella pulmonis TaxID=47312 RepID=UPI001EDE1C18|nr:DUF2207 domain-containing protein [Tsukamurella pulmonis]